MLRPRSPRNRGRGEDLRRRGAHPQRRRTSTHPQVLAELRSARTCGVGREVRR